MGIIPFNNNQKFCPSTKVDGCVGDEGNTDMWLKHYSYLLNSVNKSVIRDKVSSYLNDDSNNYAPIHISIDDVEKAPRQAKLGKSCGVDGLAAEHFIYASNCAKIYLSILFASVISLGYLHNSLMKSTTILIIKNKTDDTNDKNNYQPIALVTAMSTIFELCLFEKLNNYLAMSFRLKAF